MYSIEHWPFYIQLSLVHVYHHAGRQGQSTTLSNNLSFVKVRMMMMMMFKTTGGQFGQWAGPATVQQELVSAPDPYQPQHGYWKRSTLRLVWVWQEYDVILLCFPSSAPLAANSPLRAELAPRVKPNAAAATSGVKKRPGASKGQEPPA